MARDTPQVRPASTTAVPKDRKKKDEAIQGTNDYSIVSKRSVEKIYYAGEPEFLRPFVSKFRRRAPVINRGYWLRMRAIENALVDFLKEPTSAPKAIINLGCGYDTLPFRMLWKHGNRCSNIKFIDIDYPQLMEKKVATIVDNPVFNVQGLANEPSGTSKRILLHTAKYIAVGCDLGDISGLNSALKEELALENHAIMFIGEVSITYMEVEKADQLITWASSFENARFCLLEQHLPDGNEAPFARTMLAHFAKQTPLKSVERYPTMSDQKVRFLTRGWDSVDVANLWIIWQARAFLSVAERLELNRVEPFDEWEEFALFAGHYFLLLAFSSTATRTTPRPRYASPNLSVHIPLTPANFGLTVSSTPNSRGQGFRRFGAAFKVDEETIGYHGGLSSTASAGIFDIYSSQEPVGTLDGPPLKLVCHTITTSPDGRRHLLIGGRNSPNNVNSHSWLRTETGWQKADPFPGRYRHCAVAVNLGLRSGVLVFGGRSATGNALGDWHFVDFESGKRQPVRCSGSPPQPRWSAAIIATGDSCGQLVGGLGGLTETIFEADAVCQDIFGWELHDGAELVVHCIELGRAYGSGVRFGASLQPSPYGMLLIGGISRNGAILEEDDVVLFRPLDERRFDANVEFKSLGPVFRGQSRPMLVGFGSVATNDDQMLIFGGGAVCFSFGAFWNDRCYTLTLPSASDIVPNWQLRLPGCRTEVKEIKDESSSHPAEEELTSTSTKTFIQPTSSPPGVYPALHHAAPIPRTTVTTPQDTASIITAGQPCILTSVPLGPCTTLWTPSYLLSTLPSSTIFTIHRATTPYLTFTPTKNFSYASTTLPPFLAAAQRGENVYLRSTSSASPKTPTTLAADFPSLAPDFVLPPALAPISNIAHSSPLRIAANVAMWLHYDVMANVLCQIRGRRRIVLFPPADWMRLNFRPGDTTSALNVWTAESGALSGCSPQMAVLRPRDVLFVPACWAHATIAVGPGEDGEGEAGGEEGEDWLSIAVNVFFPSFPWSAYAVGRDVYGNRDVAAYEQGRMNVYRLEKMQWNTEDGKEKVNRLATWLVRGEGSVGGEGGRVVGKIKKRFDGLPGGVAKFYIERLAEEMREMVR
ncbi:LCM-domain-containing protein [Trichodelitschia bisporula]|uniref:tRNA wybutosine-synthesizing protein 4 n=1 Tax=Trichodelitschia bisporula TaxID=703511 RepID=A0A6G1HKX6_9PEZI|nr:LCM-domain-containing protein [Trichodelitschia bisporula]